MDNVVSPCTVLNDLKRDLQKIAKSTTPEFEGTYEFAPNAALTIVLEKRPSGVFHLQVKSPFGEETAANANYKNIAGLTVGFTWQAVCSIMTEHNLDPCEGSTHGGSDEILMLYKSLREFNKKRLTLPFSSSDVCPCPGYELLNIRQENSRCLLTIETRYIYGNLVKSVVDVQYQEQISARGKSLLDDIYGGWMRPQSVRSYKTPLEDMARASNQRAAAKRGSSGD